MRSRQRTAALTVLFGSILFAAMALAQEPPADQEPAVHPAVVDSAAYDAVDSVPDPAARGGEPASLPAVPGTPLEQEVTAVRDDFRARLTELTARYGAAADAATAATVQREIAALKLQLEIDLLAIQLRLAQERHDDDAIAELERGLTATRARLADDTGLTAAPAPAGAAH